MKRWSGKLSEEVENIDVDNFLLEVLEICKKRGYSISHEDHHGGFEVRKYDNALGEWLWGAADSTESEEE